MARGPPPSDLPSPIFNYSNVNDSVVQQNLTYNVNVNKTRDPRYPLVWLFISLIILPWLLYFVVESDSEREEGGATESPEDQDMVFLSVTTGSDHNCALEQSGLVYCWGHNNHGQIGKGFPDQIWDSTFDFLPNQVVLDSDEKAMKIVNGDQNSCLILDTLELLCWGQNNRGQVGDYSTFDSFSPMTVGFEDITSISDVVLGFQFTCAITNQGDVYCWGNNNYGQVGEQPGSEVLAPNLAMPSEGDPAIGLFTSTSSNFICALKESGMLFCWGENSNKQIGEGGESTNIPQHILLPHNLTFEDVKVGPSHVCGIANNSQLYCWGSNEDGKLGIGSENYSNFDTPQVVQFPDNNPIEAIALAWDHTCALDKSGNVLCWGSNSFAQLGNGNQLESNVPVYSSTPSNSKSIGIYADGWRSCAMMSDGSVFCWGDNVAGQIGDGSNSNRLQPTRVIFPIGLPVTDFSMSWGHSCAILNESSVWCWGANGGVLGDGSKEDSNMPVQILPQTASHEFEEEPSNDSNIDYWMVSVGFLSITGVASLLYLLKDFTRQEKR